MMIRTAIFKTSSPTLSGCPAGNLPEFAFIGRSNVGKSSLINMLCGHGGLAHTSSKPGKTQLINHFLINDEWYLVDLPGYGFAKQSKSTRVTWERMIKDYLSRRSTLVMTFVLIDGRHTPITGDIEFLQWLGNEGVPFAVIFTKTDKISQRELSANLAEYKTWFSEYFEELPMSVLSSTLSGLGKDQVLDIINQCITNLKA
jgi:GTP-binding protein